MIDHQESVFVNCVMHNVFKFMIIDSLWHLWVWLKAKVELRLCRLSMRQSQAMRWSQAMIDSNTTVTWQQHWFCVHVGEQHPSQLCICWWNSMYQTQTPTTQHWSWFKLYEQPPTLPLDVLCAIVYRFPENGDHQANITARKSFEYQWHILNAQDPLPNTRTIYTNGLIVFNHMRQRYPNLIWEDFGHFHPSPANVSTDTIPTFTSNIKISRWWEDAFPYG